MKCLFLRAFPADIMRTLPGLEEMLLFASTSCRHNENSARPWWNVAVCKHFLADLMKICQAHMKCWCLQALPANTIRTLPGPGEMLRFASTSCRHNENSARQRWIVAVCKHLLRTQWEFCQPQMKFWCLQALPADIMRTLPGPDEMLLFASTFCKHKENSVRPWWNVVVCKHFLQT